MSSYLIVEILEVFNAEKYSAYVKQVAPIISHWGGRYLVRGGSTSSFTGAWQAKRLVVIEFESRARLEACFASDAYKAICPLREDSTISRSVIVDGVEPVGELAGLAEPEELARCGAWAIRPYYKGDVEALPGLANDARIAANLRDGFPHPYTAAHARQWVDKMICRDPMTSFAITVEGKLAGSVGYELMGGQEAQAAEIGYWIGQPYREQGLATWAVQALINHVFSNTPLMRLQALPYASNIASARVLEKAGFAMEGCLRQYARKNGELRDVLLYARLRAEENAKAS